MPVALEVPDVYQAWTGVGFRYLAGKHKETAVDISSYYDFRPDSKPEGKLEGMTICGVVGVRLLQTAPRQKWQGEVAVALDVTKDTVQWVRWHQLGTKRGPLELVNVTRLCGPLDAIMKQSPLPNSEVFLACLGLCSSLRARCELIVKWAGGRQAERQ